MIGKFVNIPSYINDISYRYKMPRLVTKIEGKGNGIRTNLVNLADIAKELRVPTQYPLKFMGHELGSQTIYREKGNEITSLIQGSWFDELPTLLDKFIEKYVLCPKCKYPEINLKLISDRIWCKCRSCGTESELDNKHKVAPFIVKNPPKNIKADIEENQEMEVHQGKSKQQSKKKEEGFYGAEKLKVDGQLWKKMQKVISKHFVEDCQLEKGVKTYEGNDKVVNHLYQLMKKCKIQKKLKDRQIFIFFNSIFDMNIAKQIEKNSYLLTKYLEKIKLPKSESQLHILCTLEYFLLITHEEQNYGEKNYIPTILNYFYQEGFFENDFILDWAKGNKQNVMKKSNFTFNEEVDEQFREFAQQFVEFVKQENEGEEGDDEEDEEEEEGEEEGEEEN